MTELEKENKDLKQRLTDVTNTTESYIYWFKHYGNNGMTIQQQKFKDLERVTKFSKLLISSF